MPYKIILFFTLLTLANMPKALADTFTVTSNADSGPGTLRDAIDKANANGTTVTDYIHFDLADNSVTGRTIILGSKLPDLTSGIIIDGSTQSGVKFGLSDAKILLVAQFSTGSPQPIFNIYRLDKIGIYGLKMDNKITWTGWYPDNYAIFIDRSTNIEIGNSGKGNVIVNWEHAITVYNSTNDDQLTHSKNINIYSNFIGLNEDGVTPEYNMASIVMWKVADVNVGGLDPALGNIITAAAKRLEITRTYGGNILVANNKIGTNYYGTSILSNQYGESNHIFDNIYIQGPVDMFSTEYNTTVQVINNLSSGYCRAGVYLMGFAKKFFIQGNKFGTDITGTTRFTQGMDFGVRIDYCHQGIIGYENDESQKNIVAFAERISSGEIGLAGCGIGIVSSKGITISKNSIFCNQQKGIGIGRNEAIPIAAVNKINGTIYEGTAPPYSKIEIFEDDNCPNCEGKTYITTIAADNTGKWSYDNSSMKKIVLTATTPSGETSEFSAPLYTTNDGFKTKPATCGLNNGSITGVKVVSGTYWKWVDENGAVVSVDTNLINVGPGKYRLIVGIDNGGCEITSDERVMWRVDLPASITPSIQSTNCGKANGSISVAYDYYEFNAEWLDATGNVIATGATADKIFPGSYSLKLTALKDNSCYQVFGPYTVDNNAGPSLNTVSVQIISATCTNPNGSITGMSVSNVTGNQFTQWVNAANQPVSNSFDLNNIAPGQYRFKFKDQSSCDTLFSSFYTIADYKPIAVTGFTAKDGFCNQPDASIKINSFTIDPASYTFRWIDASSGLTIGSGTSINNLDAGTYQFFTTDNNGCEKMIFTSTLKILPEPAFDYSQATTIDDHCHLSEGAISSLIVRGLHSPATYEWYDQNNTKVGGSINLQYIPAGTYYLKVTDGGTCTVQSTLFTVNNADNTLATPLYDAIMIPRYSGATLTVRNPAAGSYSLYADAAGTTMLRQNTNGSFTVTDISSDTSFYIQRSEGSCSSPMVQANIKVVDKSYFAIPNAFSPNGDGRNDRLPVKIIGYIELSYFRLYNRWGQVVFETKKPSDSWDGIWKGNPQSEGAYVWIAEGKDIHGNTVRDRGNVVLIR